jgi:NAD(P)H-nitrite reductase large subunit
VKHVIIGAGAAGIAAAKTIRKHQSEAEIVMVSTDDEVHSRCRLHKLIGGQRNAEQLSFVPKGFFGDNGISWISGKTVTAVDAKNKRVAFNGVHETYDKLLIASGATSFLPPIEGLAAASNVYGLRDLPDAQAIREKAANARNVVVVGGGLVGLDAAYGLVEMGKKPVIVELAETILSANLDARAASVYQEKFAQANCRFRLGRKVQSVQSGKNGNVESLSLDDGELLPCDLLIVAAGVKPALGFLAESGIVCEKGVNVDECLKTSAENVYAAGDVTGLSQNWTSATKQGEVAALNMCGIKTPYDEKIVLKNTINFFGIVSLSAGQFRPKEGDIVNCREDQGRYQKVVVRDGIPVGVILQGDISRAGFWQHMIAYKISIEGTNKPVWKVSFADSYGLEENGEYKWVV